MKRKLLIGVLAMAMTAMFAGASQAALYYATSWDPASMSGVENPDAILGPPGSGWVFGLAPANDYAHFSSGGTMIVSFGTLFTHGVLGDAWVYVSAQSPFIPKLTLSAHNISSDGWDPMTFDLPVGVFGGFDTVDPTASYDKIKLVYSDITHPDFYIDAIGVRTASPVPEPGTMILLGIGLVGLATFGRKKFRK